MPGGGLVPSYRFDGIRLLQYQSKMAALIILAEALFVIYTIYYSVLFLRGVCRGKCAFMRVCPSAESLF
jgi:hypothetical protein